MSQFVHQDLEESKQRVEKAIRTNYLKTDGNWFVSLMMASGMVALPVGFTWMCLDFLFEVNLMNIFLCSVTGCLVVYAFGRIIWYLTCSHRLFAVHTGLRSKKARAITHHALASLGYSISESNQYFTIASKRATYKAPNETITALFQENTVYLHAQIVQGWDECILQRRNPILNPLINAITHKLA
jgi:uncharacterized membrane protein